MVIQNPMKVKYIKLLNAEELVAKVVEETDTILEIKDPAIIMLRPAEKQGNMAVQMGHYCPHTKENLKLNKAHVLYMAEPHTDLVNGYKKIFGSGIVMPSVQLNG